MIIGALTLISMLFLGSSSGLLPLDNFRTDVNQYIEEPDRRKEILRQVDNFEVDLAQNFHERKKRVDKFLHLFKQYNTTEKEMNIIVDSINYNTEKHLNSMMKNWIQLNEMIERDEWEKIIDIDEKSYEKLKNDRVDLGKRIEERNTQTIEEFEQSLSKEKSALIIEKYAIMYSNFYSYFNHLYHQKQSDLELFMKYKAGKNEFQKKFKKFVELQQSTLDEIQAFHFETKEILTAKEWEKVIHTTSKVLNLD